MVIYLQRGSVDGKMGVLNKKTLFVLSLSLITLIVILVGYKSFNDKHDSSRVSDATYIEAKKEEEKKKKEIDDFKRPLLVLTFDDGFETDYSIVYPLLKERDIVGTSFINADHIETGKKSRRMTWEQIKEMEAGDWDIQGHTFTHPRLTELTDEEIHQEFELNNDAFEKNGLSSPKHTAYPYGNHNENVRDIGKEYRKSLRRTKPVGDIPYNTWDNIDFHNLNARGTDIHDDNIERLDERKKDIDLAIENDGILIFFSHEFKESGAEQYETQVEYYEELIDYAIEKGMEFVTISEMYELVKEYQKIAK